MIAPIHWSLALSLPAVMLVAILRGKSRRLDALLDSQLGFLMTVVLMGLATLAIVFATDVYQL